MSMSNANAIFLIKWNVLLEDEIAFCGGYWKHKYCRSYL